MDELLPLLLRTVHQLSVYGTLITSRLAGPAKKYLESNPDLKSVALMLVIAYISLAIVNIATRWVVGVVRFAVSIVFWVAVVAAGMWVAVVGPMQAVDTVLVMVEVGRKWVLRESIALIKSAARTVESKLVAVIKTQDNPAYSLQARHRFALATHHRGTSQLSTIYSCGRLPSSPRDVAFALRSHCATSRGKLGSRRSTAEKPATTAPSAHGSVLEPNCA
ncbi:hypothetical protein K440DRAFT_660311 [Wilcoxina mikolae CBS 423.85]|nr:hypothetical protein K440DRAFT_660311 [Wilcoxina mikolae CBS 423.85]